MENRLLTLLVKRAPWLFLVCVVVAGTLSYFSVDLHVAKNRKPWFEKDDPFLQSFLKFRKTFNTGEIILAAFELPHPITPTDISALRDFRLEVGSLDNIIDVTSVDQFFAEAEAADNSSSGNSKKTEFHQNIKNNCARTPMGEYLISDDFRTVIVGINALYDDSATYNEMSAIKKTITDLEQLQGKFKSRLGNGFLTGNVVVDDHMTNTIQSDVGKLLPAAFGVALLVLLFLMRPLSMIIWPVLSMTMALGATMGIKALCQSEFTVLSSCLFAVVLVIGTADSIHLIQAFFANKHSGVPSPIVYTLKRTGAGCFFTSLTTALGFLSLSFSPIPIVNQLGLFAAIGIGLSFVFTIISCVVGFRFAKNLETRSTALDKLVNGFVVANQYPKRAIGIITVLTAVLLGFLWHPVEVDGTLIRNFKKAAPVRQQFDRLEQQLGGLAINEIVIEGQPGDFLKRTVLDKLSAVEEKIKETLSDSNGNTGSNVYSGNAVFRMLENSESPQKESPFDLMMKAKMVGNLKLGQYFTSDFSAARISVFVPTSEKNHCQTAVDIAKKAFSHSEVDSVVGSVSSPSDQHRAADSVSSQEHQSAFRVTYTGYGRMSEEITDRIVRTLVTSFWCTILGVSLIIVLLFGWKAGLLSLIPNIIPILTLYATMAAFSYTLNIGTAMIAAISYGIIIDDTVHLFFSYHSELKKNKVPATAMKQCLQKTGKAIIISSILFVVGLGTFAFSDIAMLTDLGILSAVVVALALIFDLVLTPALLVIFGKLGGLSKKKKGI